MNPSDLVRTADAEFALTRVGIVAAVLLCFAGPRLVKMAWDWVARKVGGR